MNFFLISSLEKISAKRIERRRDGQIEVGIRIPGLNSTSESKDPDFWGSSLFLAIWAAATLTVILGCSVPNPVFHPPLF